MKRRKDRTNLTDKQTHWMAMDGIVCVCVYLLDLLLLVAN